VVIERLDSLVVGALLGNRPAGLYHQARMLSETTAIATRPLERLSLNLYARVQDDPHRLTRAWQLVNYFLLRVMLALSAALLVFPAETVRLLLGEEWLDAAPVLRWLALYSGLLPVLYNLKNLCYGLGRVSRVVRVHLAQVACFAPAVLAAGLLDSIEGVAAAVLVTTVGALVLAWQLSRDLVERFPTRLVVTPLAVLGATCAALWWLGDAGQLASLPWFTLPFLPPCVYAALLLAVERGRLLHEIGYVLAVLRGARDVQP
jgi:PST family polysaccharide transporter